MKRWGNVPGPGAEGGAQRGPNTEPIVPPPPPAAGGGTLPLEGPR